jgi:hypothetical protein
MIKKLGYFLFLAFLDMVASNLHALQAGLLLLPERLSEVCCCAISLTPISALPWGLLSENEAGQLALRPRPPLKEWECCQKLSKNCGRHCFGRLARPELLLLRLKGTPFGCPPWPTSLRASGYPESSVNRSSQQVMGLSEFSDTFAGHSPLAAISAIEAFQVNFFWSAAAVTPTLPFDERLFLHSRQGLVMVDLLDNFLNHFKLFWASVSDFTKSSWKRMEGVRRER